MAWAASFHETTVLVCAITAKRAVDAIGIVEPLEARLPTRAEGPGVDRMLRIALGLGDAGFTLPEMHSAPGRALATGGGKKVTLSRPVVVHRLDIGDQPLRVLDPGRPRRPPRCCR